MSEGRILKPDKDFAKEVEKLIPEAQKLAKVASYIKERQVKALLTCIG